MPGGPSCKDLAKATRRDLSLTSLPFTQCSSGKCTCTGGRTLCSGAGCQDLGSSTSHCGACGRSCAASQIVSIIPVPAGWLPQRRGSGINFERKINFSILQCSGGQCVCPDNRSFCPNSGGCVSLSSDTGNCGSCGTSCPAGQIVSLLSACCWAPRLLLRRG